MKVTFRLPELTALAKHPGALQAMADYNDQMAAEADAQGYTECTEFHEKRAREFEAESKRIRAEWEGSVPAKPSGSLAVAIAHDKADSRW